MMMSFSSTILSSCLVIVALYLTSPSVIVDASTLDDRQAPLACSICRRNDRPLMNPDHVFTMPNSISWSCEYLQETVQDVDENSMWEGERIMCRHAQLQAEQNGCICGGSYMEPLSEQYHDLNPSCDMCGTVPTSNIVPHSNYEKLVDTRIIGKHNCLGLYEALATGVISSHICPQVQAIAGQACCIDESAPPVVSTTTSSSSSPSSSSLTSATQYKTATGEQFSISYTSGGNAAFAPAADTTVTTESTQRERISRGHTNLRGNPVSDPVP